MSEIDISKKRLKWQCRRGMLELDVLLNRYLDERYTTLNENQRLAFQELLTIEDPELYAFIMGQKPIPREHQETIDAIKQWSDH
jgi:antitoxin CptB